MIETNLRQQLTGLAAVLNVAECIVRLADQPMAEGTQANLADRTVE